MPLVRSYGPLDTIARTAALPGRPHIRMPDILGGRSASVSARFVIALPFPHTGKARLSCCSENTRICSLAVVNSRRADIDAGQNFRFGFHIQDETNGKPFDSVATDSGFDRARRSRYDGVRIYPHALGRFLFRFFRTNIYFAAFMLPESARSTARLTGADALSRVFRGIRIRRDGRCHRAKRATCGVDTALCATHRSAVPHGRAVFRHQTSPALRVVLARARTRATMIARAARKKKKRARLVRRSFPLVLGA